MVLSRSTSRSGSSPSPSPSPSSSPSPSHDSSHGSSSGATLSADELKSALSSLKEWQIDSTEGDNAGGALKASFRFAGFRAACGFMTQVWLLSERYDHHPIARHNYRQVDLWWRSHDVGGISKRDVAMAERCQKLALDYHALI